MKVFIDTSVYIALMLETELTHLSVVNAFREYTRTRASFFTSDFVLDELFTRLVYDHNPLVVKRCIKFINQAKDRNELKVFNVDAATFSAAEKTFLKYIDLRLSFTDATIIAHTRAFKIDHIFTLDDGFRKARMSVTPGLKV